MRAALARRLIALVERHKMPLLLTAEAAMFATSIQLSDFPALSMAHASKFPTTPSVESNAEQLRKNNFAEQDAASFVKGVCDWGGYSGVGGRVLKRNAHMEVAAALREADALLALSSPQIRKALERMNQLNCLGTPSFASKHLRFLRPDLCPVFDSFLQVALPYAFTPTGYQGFAFDCVQIATELNTRNVQGLPRRAQQLWFAADVEAAIYMHVARLRSDA